MPRPSLKSERVTEILDACGRCIIQHGVEGATLERIAAEAGLARPLIRHHIGNRDALLELFVQRFVDEGNQKMRALINELEGPSRSHDLIHRLFSKEAQDLDAIHIAEALMTATHRAEIATSMNLWIDTFLDDITDIFHKDYPDAINVDIRIVVTGIVGIYFNSQSLSLLGSNTSMHEYSRRAALRLMATLNR